MRLIPRGLTWLLGGSLALAGVSAIQGYLTGLVVGLVLFALGTAWSGAWIHYRLRRLRDWLHSWPGSVSLSGDESWDTLESELRYLLKHWTHQLEEVRERVEWLEQVAQDLPIGVVALDPRGRLLEANPKAYELLGLDSKRVQGQRLQGWLRDPELQWLFSLEGPATQQATALSYHPDPNRTLTFTRSRKEDGSSLLLVEEITERVHLQRVRKDFVANVSHELKSPLTSLRGFTETLLEGPELPSEKRQEFLQIMEDQLQRMQRLVDDLLTLSRLEVQAETPPRTAVALEALLSELEEQFAPQAEQRNIQLDFSPVPSKLNLYGDTAALIQALGNLIDNALKYTPEGGYVQVVVETRQKEIGVAVCDSGIGIEAQYLPRVTERFFRVDKGRSRAIGGTGLGLSITKHILNHHEGHLEIKSTPGEGSRFTALFPRQPDFA